MRKAKRSQSASVLFIGNSFTQRNNLPGLIAGMAAEGGLNLKHQLISAGGASLRTHWNAGRAVEAIKSGGFGHVVLQEQSTLPVKNAGRMAENVRLFDEVIKQAGAKTVLYMTWSRQHSPEHQPLIAQAYASIGNELGATVVPVGLAWSRFISKCDSSILYDSDQSHPSLAGSFLAACVFLAVLFRFDVVEIKAVPSQLDARVTAKIRRAVLQISGRT
jgi:hypothetical protein